MPLFPLLRKTSPAGDVAPKPRHIEIWEHLVEVNRVLKRLVYASCSTAFVAVAFAVWMALLAFDRPVVYYVDASGAAASGGRLGTVDVPQDVEVRYVARSFLQHTLAFNSMTVESDLAQAWNLMTTELRDQQSRQLAEYEHERGTAFVDFVRNQKIRTSLDFRKIELTNHNDKTWAVRITGLARTWPLSRVGEEAGFAAKEFEAQLTLVRVARTETTPNGLLVSHQATRFFEAKDEARALEETVPAGAAGPASNRSEPRPKSNVSPAPSR